MLTPLAVVVTVLLPLLVDSCDIAALRGWATSRLNDMSRSYNGNPCEALSGGRALSTNNAKPQVKLFLFHQDEEDLLFDWLQYHSFMFGIQNIHVVDHRSEGEGVCKTLALYATCGATVTEYNGEFKFKNRILTNLMRMTKGDFLLPLDADEFVVYTEKDVNTTTLCPTAMQQAFARLPQDGRKYKYRQYTVKYSNDTCSQDHASGSRRLVHQGYLANHGYSQEMVKTFFPVKGFEETDQGNHRGRVSRDRHVFSNDLGDFYHFTDITLLHFALTSYRALAAKVLRGAQAYKYDERTDCSKVGLGVMYCQHAEAFRNQTERSRQHFLGQCQASADEMPIHHSFARWFARNVPEMEEITGQLEPRGSDWMSKLQPSTTALAG